MFSWKTPLENMVNTWQIDLKKSTYIDQSDIIIVKIHTKFQQSRKENFLCHLAKRSRKPGNYVANRSQVLVVWNARRKKLCII